MCGVTGPVDGYGGCRPCFMLAAGDRVVRPTPCVPPPPIPCDTFDIWDRLPDATSAEVRAYWLARRR